jgi:hypothetical protein
MLYHGKITIDEKRTIKRKILLTIKADFYFTLKRKA